MQSAEKSGGEAQAVQVRKRGPQIPGLASPNPRPRHRAVRSRRRSPDRQGRARSRARSEVPSDWSHVARRGPRVANLLTARAG